MASNPVNVILKPIMKFDILPIGTGKRQESAKLILKSLLMYMISFSVIRMTYVRAYGIYLSGSEIMVTKVIIFISRYIVTYDKEIQILRIN